ncbi:MAG: type I secretion system permease/ATPase, partial [Desulfobulbaceae bacterium]|nr:type I secretion system permease/ATPase [Desulfobulbaceae bacterium]
MQKEMNRDPKGEWKPVSSADSHFDPLLDSLLLIAKLHGRSVTRTSLQTGLPLVHGLLTVELFSRAAGRADLSSRVLQRPLKEIKEMELPAIVLLKDKKACVVLSKNKDSGMVKVLFPESGMGETELSLDELAEMYTGYAIFVRPKYRIADRSLDDIQTRSTKNWFWGVIFSNWRLYRGVLIASLLINIFGLASPFFILNVYDRVIPNNAFETLWVLSIGITIIYLFLLLMRGLRGYFIDEAGKKANLQISSSLMEKVLGLRMEVRPQSVGSFSKNLQQFEEIRDFITSFAISAIIDLPFVALGLFVVWYIAGNLVLILVVAIILLLGYALAIQIPLKKAVEKSFAASAQKNAILVEGLTGLETIKMLGAESQIQRAWEESVSYIAKW